LKILGIRFRGLEKWQAGCHEMVEARVVALAGIHAELAGAAGAAIVMPEQLPESTSYEGFIASLNAI
jgi:hypothetical protein